MLTTLRNSSKNSILKIIFGTLLTILIISFGMWGTEDLVGVTQKQSTVATVGKIDVSAQEFYSLYSRQTEEIRKLLGSSLDIKKSREFGYVDRALSSLVNRALFNNEASELGLSVSDINVRDKILKDDAFKKSVLTQPAAIKTVVDFSNSNNCVKFFDAGDVQANGFQIAEDKNPFQTYTDTGASYMGFSPSAILASAIANKPRYPISFTGDGSFMMNPQVLIDAVHIKLKGMIVIFSMF